MNVSTFNSESPLFVAAKRGHLEVCNWMIQAGADATNCLDPLLYCAALHGDLARCQQWVQAGAGVNKVNADGYTPVNIAAKQGHYDLCYYFMDLGVNLNVSDNDGLTPLYFICQDGDNELVKKFLDNGADVDSPGCLHVALDNYNITVAQILVEMECDVNKVIWLTLFQ